MTETRTITLIVNGETATRTVPVRMSLADFLRTELRLTGTRLGCEHGVCGACTIEVDGSMVRSCLMLAVQAQDARVVTVEGFSDGGRSDALRTAFANRNALQCGYCTSGMLASALEYIEDGGVADREAIRKHISGNYCRCTGYQAVIDAICDAIERKNQP